MSLFGGAPAVAPVAPTAPIVTGFPAALDDDEPEPAGPSLHQRRQILRDKRHRLVGDLRRRDGSSHKEINAWLNRRCGVRKVNAATMEQLERSIDLLLGELTTRR